MCGTLAKDQNRCILTRKKHYNALSRTVDQGNCLAVKEDLPADQVNEVFSFFKGTNIDLVYIVCNIRKFTPNLFWQKFRESKVLVKKLLNSCFDEILSNQKNISSNQLLSN